jgi:hypothetical protein
MRAQHHHLIEVRIDRLRPTQITVGRVEVAAKRAEWKRLDRKERRRRLSQHWFPAVIGPKQRHYIVDHHHLGLALHEEQVESAWLMVLRDFSWLETERFWRVMEFHQWAHPYDNEGRRCDYDNIPRRVTELQDDPYRSLAGFVRAAGGFAKDSQPYAEFLWADFFRPLIDRDAITTATPVAVEQAVNLARSEQARYLPGWGGIGPAK